AFHYRRVANGSKERAEAAALAGPASRAGVHVRRGHQVVELLVVGADKGEALDRLRRELGADAVLFVGDDRTDEDAFARLRPGADLGVKVGPGPTRATARIAGQPDVGPLLRTLLSLREARLSG
ncbi:MAG: trehalose-phosphatase, partial [Gemmatimonadota bacterium]